MAQTQVHQESVRTLNTDSSKALVGRGLRKRHGQLQILDGVDLVIKPGQISALIGPSGAGKTTLLKALSLIDAPDEGTIDIDGVQYNFPSRRGEKITPPWPVLTVVFQQLFLWPHMTLRQNILLPMRAKGKAANEEYLETLIELFGMRKFIDRFPNEVSLGQRQRVALARALVLEPRYILLDEITSSLDIEQIAVILKELKLVRDRGIGMLIITHLLRFAEEAADSIIFMDSGKIVEQGGSEVLLRPSHPRTQQFLSVVASAS